MDFDQMLDAWKAQNDKPLYGVNGELLQLVLRHEQTDIRRQLRREQWTTYGVGAGMAALGAALLWAFLYFDGPLPYVLGAIAGTGAFVLWMAGLWLSLRRQRQRERQFGNTLRAEIARNLSLLDYQLSRYGRWGTAVLWAAPVMVGAGLIYWLMAAVNHDPGESGWIHVWIAGVLVWSAVYVPYTSSRELKRKLEPRQQRLRELLEALDASK